MMGGMSRGGFSSSLVAAILVLAAAALWLIVLTTGWLDPTWLQALVTAAGALGLVSLVLSAWQKERTKLSSYTHSEAELSEEEIEAAEAYDAEWRRAEHRRATGAPAGDQDAAPGTLAHFEFLVARALEDIPPGLRG